MCYKMKNKLLALMMRFIYLECNHKMHIKFSLSNDFQENWAYNG